MEATQTDPGRWYILENGSTWGPFTHEDRAELDGTARRPIVWLDEAEAEYLSRD